ncbi:hypothetical protein D9M71_826410 [compost metagenome]
MSLDIELDAFAFELRDQLIHGAHELVLAHQRVVRLAGELGVDQFAVHLYGNLDRALPVAHRGHAQTFIGSGPVVHR